MTHTYILHQALRAARRGFSAAEWCVCAAAFMSIYLAYRAHRAWVRSGRPVFGWRWRLVMLPHQLRAAAAVRREVRRFQQQRRRQVAALERLCGVRPAFPWVRVALGCAVLGVIGVFAWQWLALLGAVVAVQGVQFGLHYWLFGGRQQYQRRQQFIAQRYAQPRR